MNHQHNFAAVAFSALLSTQACGASPAVALVVPPPVNQQQSSLAVPHTMPQTMPNAKTPSSSVQWIPVPEWLGGTWWASSQVILYSYNYRTQQPTVKEPIILKISRVSTIGMQKDTLGNIWHYTGAPYHRVTETDSYTEFHEIESTELQRTGTPEVRILTRSKVTRCAKENSQLLDTFMELTTISYVPLQSGLVQVSFLISDFDLDGKPLFLTRAVSIEKRVKPFQVININERGDLRLKFQEFMSGGNRN